MLQVTGKYRIQLQVPGKYKIQFYVGGKGIQVPGTGCQLPGNAEYSYRFQVTGSRERQNTVTGFLVPVSRKDNVRFRLPGTGYRERRM
jgi:hypothetical protein